MISVIHNIQVVTHSKALTSKTAIRRRRAERGNRIKVLLEYWTAWPADVTSTTEQRPMNLQDW